MRSRSSTGAVRWLSPRQTSRCTPPQILLASIVENRSMRALGIDVGGTFTDAVLVEDGEVRIAKVPTAARQQESVVGAAAAVGAADVERFTHGTTIATNALLQRRGARTALVTNEGFEHVLHLRRQTRAHLYRPCVEHPPPLVPLERCVGVRGRTARGRRADSARPGHAARDRRRGDRRLAPLLLPRRGAGASRGRRAPPPLSVGARRRLARGRARVPRVRASVDDRGRRLPRACSVAVSRRRSPPPAPTRSFRRRW